MLSIYGSEGGVKVKLGFIQDINPWENVGGAQKNDLEMIKYCQYYRYFEFDIISPQNVNNYLNKKFDLVIISNCVNFSHEILEKITENNPYVLFHHDYNFCKHRLFFPGLDSCKECDNLKWWERFIGNSRKNIFLSPQHKETYQIVFSNIPKPKIVPSNIDVEFWHSTGKERKKNTVIGVNCLYPFKGRYSINTYITQHPELSFTLVGGGTPLNQLNAQYLPQVSSEELRDLYSQHEFFIHLPETSGPFDRTVMEALLCNCKLVVNKNIGSMSYPWNYSKIEEIRFMLQQAGVGFADEIQETYNQVKGK